jgi:hypothetical protein
MLNLYNFMDGIDGLAGGEAAVASSFFFLVFAYYGQSGWAVANLHPGRYCGADRFGGFRGRGDRLRRSLGMGEGTPEPNPRTGTFLELPQIRDTLCNDAWGRPVPIPWEFQERPGSGVSSRFLVDSQGFR